MAAIFVSQRVAAPLAALTDDQLGALLDGLAAPHRGGIANFADTMAALGEMQRRRPDMSQALQEIFHDDDETHPSIRMAALWRSSP